MHKLTMEDVMTLADLPKAIVLPQPIMEASQKLASSNSAATNSAKAMEYVGDKEWAKALPFAVAETLQTSRADAMVRAGICFEELAELAVLSGRAGNEDARNLDLAIAFFNCAEEAGERSPEFLTLRGSAYLLKAQVNSDANAAMRARLDFGKVCARTPTNESAKRNFDRAMIVHDQLKAQPQGSGSGSRWTHKRSQQVSPSPSPAKTVPAMRGLGILFDIDALGGGFYAAEAWQLLMNNVDLATVTGCQFREGDTSATIDGRARVFCIGIEGPGLDVRALKDRIGKLTDRGFQPLSVRFIDLPELAKEPLVPAGRVDSSGRFIDDSWTRIRHDLCKEAGWGYDPVRVPSDLPIDLQRELDDMRQHKSAGKPSSRQEDRQEHNVAVPAHFVMGEGVDADSAIALAQSKLPHEAIVEGEPEITRAGTTGTMVVRGRSEDAAKEAFWREAPEGALLVQLELTVGPKRGLLGLGGRHGTWVAHWATPTRGRIRYRLPDHMEVKAPSRAPQAWSACLHDTLSPIYFRAQDARDESAATGYTCTRCGRNFTVEQARAVRARLRVQQVNVPVQQSNGPAPDSRRRNPSCHRCHQPLVMSQAGPLGPQLYQAIVCDTCKNVECIACKSSKGSLDAPCSWCGASVSPAYKKYLNP
jgi:hypothetical protein